jgi:hypothetical protein
MSVVPVNKKKVGFFKRNADKIKVGGVVVMSFSGIAVIIAGVVMHIINPTIGFVTIPLAVQALLTTLIKRAPQTIIALKAHVEKILEGEEDPEVIGRFVDDVISRYTTTGDNATVRTVVPPMRPNEPMTRSVMNEPLDPDDRPRNRNVSISPPIQMNAYYFADTDQYEITPRVEPTPTRRPSIMPRNR